MTPPLPATDLDHVLTHTKGLWEEVRGQRLFITGGTGFFGRWLLESFVWANERLELKAEAVVLTRDPDAFAAKTPHLANHPALAFHGGDVRTFDRPRGEFSHVVHAATESSSQLNRERPLEMLDTIVLGTRRTLEFARAAGAHKFLLTSSGAVYGKQPAELTHISEEYLGGPDPTDPASTYAEGKRVAELLCVLAGREGLECKIARCFAFVGPGLPLDAHFAIGNFIRDALVGEAIGIQGDGTPYRSYLYAADLAIWLWTILFQGATGRPYNVGSAEDLTIADLARTVATGVGQPNLEVRIARAPAPGRPPERYVPAIERAARQLGLRAWIELREAIRRTCQWHLESENVQKAGEANLAPPSYLRIC